MDKKSKDRFEITELFMAMADKDRCFTGIIKRLNDAEGNPFVFSRIVVNDGLLCASTPEQKELGRNLDEMCIMICDKKIHGDAGVTTKIFDADFFLN
jgi:hypothetical protein